MITEAGRELLGGCIVVPIPDPQTGTWTTLYGRGVRTARHCYLPGPLRGVWNFQAARASDTVILTESVLDAISFHQAGTATAMPIYGTQGCTTDLLDHVARDIDALGFVGEATNTRLLYLVAISRKLPDPLSAIVLSQSGAGKSGLTEVLERLTPPEAASAMVRPVACCEARTS